MTCTCDTCGRPADVTLSANGHSHNECTGCVEAYAPMYDYKITAARPLRAVKAARVFGRGSEVPEILLPECFEIGIEVTPELLASIG